MSLPPGAIAHHDHVVVRVAAGDLVKDDVHAVSIDMREHQTVEAPVPRTRRTIGVGVWLRHHSADERPSRTAAPTGAGVTDTSEPGFVLEHQPQRPAGAPSRYDLVQFPLEFFPVVATDLEVTRIQVTKDYATMIAPVRGDETKLQQVFLSIFKNAGEAMNPGGHLHIQVTQHRAGRGVEDQILIKNDGAPIPAEIVDKVFEPFFTTKRTGIGLGLASVKKIIEEHGGSIAIGSAPGEGTTVTIRLPGLSHGPSYRGRGRRRPPRTPPGLTSQRMLKKPASIVTLLESHPPT